MPIFEKTINLNVPATTVFHYLTDPACLLEMCPNIIEISDIQRHTPSSTKFNWIARLLGVRFEGEAELKQTHHDQQLNSHFWGGLRGNAIIQLHPSDEGILLRVELDYTLPPPLLKKHREDVILWQFEHSVDCALASLKTLLEADVTVS